MENLGFSKELNFNELKQVLSDKTIADVSKQEMTLLETVRASKSKPRPGPERGIIKRGWESRNSCCRKVRPQVGHAQLTG